MKKTSTDKEIKISNKRIKKVTKGKASNDDVFVLCKASKLSLNDKFMKYEPRTKNEKEFKELLEKAIKNGVRDFYRPKFDPSIDEQGKIFYGKGNTPVVGKTYAWWKEKADNFWPKRKSRIGRHDEYIAFLGTVIKKLLKVGWGIEDAWNAVCNDSAVLGHYWNSPNNKCRCIEPTGSREVAGFFDLANTHKILSNGKGGIYTAGGSAYDDGDYTPLASLWPYDRWNITNEYGVGWIVLEK